ncbi:MAG: DUF2490 domain-containing protein [Alphaproteobacteria bacterium]|nr:DUF2490 domain-containing protein [Alphaproteobacteria bacterium]
MTWLWLGIASAAPLSAWEGLVITAAPPGEKESRLRLWFDGHARRGDSFVSIVRPGVGVDLGGGVALWAGYGWIATATPGDLASEHRVWEQITWNRSGKRGGGGLRGRLEQRFGDRDGLGLRFRAFGRAQADVAGPLSLVIWDELFVGLNDTDWGAAGIDQNRLFGGPAWRAGKLRAETGLLVQAIHRGGDWTTVPVVATNLFLSL